VKLLSLEVRRNLLTDSVQARSHHGPRDNQSDQIRADGISVQVPFKFCTTLRLTPNHSRSRIRNDSRAATPRTVCPGATLS